MTGDTSLGTLEIIPYNDYVHSTAISWIMETFVVFETTIIEYTVKEKVDANDANYSKVLYKSSLDLGKLIKQIRGNLLSKTFSKMVLTSDIKFPLPKVSFSLLESI